MDPNNFNIKSSYKTYSKVCQSDENNPGRMICKEYGDENGKKIEKEYIKEIPNYKRNEISNFNTQKSNENHVSPGVFDLM